MTVLNATPYATGNLWDRPDYTTGAPVSSGRVEREDEILLKLSEVAARWSR